MKAEKKAALFREVRTFFADWKWIAAYSRQCKKIIALYIFIGIFGTTFGAFTGVAGKYLIDVVVGRDTARLPVLAAVMLFGTALSVVTDYSLSRVLKKLESALHYRVRADVFDRILAADWQAQHAFSGGDILNRFETDTGAVSGGAVSWLPQILVTMYRLCTAFFLIWHYDRTMALIALCGAPAALLFSAAALRRRRAFETELRRFGSEMTAFEAETFYNLEAVKALDMTNRCGKNLREKQAALYAFSLKYTAFSARMTALLQTVSALTQFAAMGYGLFLLWSNSITFGTLTLFLQQRSNLTGAFESAAGLVPKFLSTAVSADRVRALCTLQKERRVPGILPAGALAAELKNVTVSYENGEKVLQNISFFAAPGEAVALTGASGAGKTTLLRVLLGLLTPESGQAVLRGEDGRTVEISAGTREAFSYVPQGDTLFSGSISENLRAAKEDASREELVFALKTACAWEFVSALPNGLDTRLSTHGGELSRGQAQRIAIARAVLKNAPVLLLDEATSALDEKTEEQVLRNLITALPQTTCIFTTHRPGVLRYCTRVYCTENGRLTCAEIHKPA